MLCLNSLCLFISAHYLKICVDKTSWLVVSLNHCPSVWGPQTIKEQSKRFFTFETMITFLTLVLLTYNERCYSRDLWPLWHLFRVMRWPDLTKKNFAMLWHLRHWLQYRQLRTWIHDNLCYLTINCDTGQHSQFLRCFHTRVFFGYQLVFILNIWFIISTELKWSTWLRRSLSNLIECAL